MGILAGNKMDNSNQYGSFIVTTQETEDMAQLFNAYEEPKKNKCCRGHELLITLFCTLGPMSFGCCMGITSPTVPNLKKQGIMTKSEATWYESLILLGVVFGMVPTIWLIDAAGRKMTTLIGVIPHGIGCMILFLAKRNIALFYAGRIFQGIAGGVWTISFVIYVGETASKYTRGAMSTGFQLGMSIGIMISYLSGMILNTSGLSLIALVPAVFMVLGLCFMPESPRWLLKNKRVADTISALTWLREVSFEEVEQEFKEIQRNIDIHDTSIKLSKACLSQEIPRTWRQFAIGLSLVMFSQLTGVNVILFNAAEIFTLAGFSTDGHFGSQTQAFIFGGVKLVTLIPAIFLIDKYGRRPLFFFGALLMSISCVVLGFFFNMDKTLMANHGWIAATSLIIYISAFDIGMGTIPWLVLGEIMPIRVRGIATGIVAIISVTAGFILAKEYQNMVDVMSMDGLFWVFGGMSFLATIFACVVMPETKQHSLEAIEDKFDSHTENSEFMKGIFGEYD